MQDFMQKNSFLRVFGPFDQPLELLFGDHFWTLKMRVLDEAEQPHQGCPVDIRWSKCGARGWITLTVSPP